MAASPNRASPQAASTQYGTVSQPNRTNQAEPPNRRVAVPKPKAIQATQPRLLSGRTRSWSSCCVAGAVIRRIPPHMRTGSHPFEARTLASREDRGAPRDLPSRRRDLIDRSSTPPGGHRGKSRTPVPASHRGGEFLGCPWESRTPGGKPDDRGELRPAGDREKAGPARAGSRRPYRSCRRREETPLAPDTAAACEDPRRSSGRCRDRSYRCTEHSTDRRPAE